MISAVFAPDCFKVLSLFSLSPGSRFNRKEIKAKTWLNNVPLDKALLILLNSGLFKREGNYYFIDWENEYVKKLLEICTKQYRQWRELPLDVYYLLVDLTNVLSTYRGLEVILFGSYAKLIYRQNSDIDIALIFSGKIDKEQLSKMALKLEKVYQKKVELHYFEKQQFYRNKKDPLVRGILKDGIKLIG
jgi:predicted nucleotidyltransferase